MHQINAKMMSEVVSPADDVRDTRPTFLQNGSNSTHRNRKDLTVVLVASLHHFIGIFEELGNHTDKRNPNDSRRCDQRWGILSSATRSQEEKPKKNQASSPIVIPHIWNLAMTIEDLLLLPFRIEMFREGDNDRCEVERYLLQLYSDAFAF